MTASAFSFGTVLREWRQHRRCSQLDLSVESGISQRHISFLETGRSRPSREMVLALADSLDIPLRERNRLLQSAGYAAAYAESSLGDDELAVFQQALAATLDHHEPYPAIVLDGRWNLVMANEAALRFFRLFIDPAKAIEEIGSPPDFHMVRLCLAEVGFKPYIDNWHELVSSFLQRARRALILDPSNEALKALIDEIRSHPDARERWRSPDWSAPPPAIQLRMSRGEERYCFYTMLAHFGAVKTVTLDELSVESFHPADENTKARLMALAGH